MEERTVILNIESESTKSYTVATSFSAEEIDEVIYMIQEQLAETESEDDLQESNVEEVIASLESKGYIRVIGPGPEIMNLSI